MRSGRPGRASRPLVAAPLAAQPTSSNTRSSRCAASVRPASLSPKRVGVSPATVSRVLSAAGLNHLDHVEPVRRYERETPGELIHIDIEETWPHQQRRPSHHSRSLRTKQELGREFGITIARVMTDNAARYKALAFRDARRDLCLRHIRAKSYHPTNQRQGRAFIQTALCEWAYARLARLPSLLHDYNWHLPTAAPAPKL